METQSLPSCAGAAELPQKHVQFDDAVETIPSSPSETDYVDEYRWLSPDDIASFRTDTLRTVQAQRALEKEEGGQTLNEEEFCLRGLEQKLLKRPPPNFVKRVLRLQAKQKRSAIKDPATGLQLFSEACSKWARKRAIQLAAEDEFAAYQIFMSGLRKPQYDKEGDDSDDDDDEDYYEDEEFDFCTEGDFVNDIYDYKHDHTEDETEFDDSDGVYDTVVAVDKDGKRSDLLDAFDPFDVEDEDDLFTPVY